MSIGSSQPAPAAPTTYPIYRGFYVLPGDNVSSLLPAPIQVNFFVARSSDNLTWENWTLVGQGNNTTGFYTVHSGIDENTYYAYYCQYQYSDGSVGPTGSAVYPGKALLIANSNLNIDQLASRAYSTGLVTSGIFRGVIFQTSATNPVVQLDSTGLWAKDANGNNTFYIYSDGVTPSVFTGQISALGLTLPSSANTATPDSTSDIAWTDLSNRVAADIYGAGISSPEALQQANIANNAATTPIVGTVDWSPKTFWNGAQHTPSALSTSYYIYVYLSGARIPSAATINGIKVSFYRTLTGSGSLTDNKAQLIKGGVLQASNKAGGQWGAGTTLKTYGSSADLWGTTWTPSDINNGQFGFALSVSASTASPLLVTLSSVLSVTVYYTVNQTVGSVNLRADPTNILTSSQVKASAGAAASIRIYDSTGASDFGQTSLNLSDMANKSTALTNLLTAYGTTGSGSVVLSTSPTITGTLAAGAVTSSSLTLSGNLTFDSTSLRAIVAGTANGLKIGNASNQLLGFFGAAPVAQPSSTGATGRTNGTVTGQTFHPDDTYTGALGTTAYTVGDIVKHLKELGLLAQ